MCLKVHPMIWTPNQPLKSITLNDEWVLLGCGSVALCLWGKRRRLWVLLGLHGIVGDFAVGIWNHHLDTFQPPTPSWRHLESKPTSNFQGHTSHTPLVSPQAWTTLQPFNQQARFRRYLFGQCLSVKTVGNLGKRNGGVSKKTGPTAPVWYLNQNNLTPIHTNRFEKTLTLQGTRKHIPPWKKREIINSKVPAFWGGYVIVPRRVFFNFCNKKHTDPETSETLRRESSFFSAPRHLWPHWQAHGASGPVQPGRFRWMDEGFQDSKVGLRMPPQKVSPSEISNEFSWGGGKVQKWSPTQSEDQLFEVSPTKTNYLRTVRWSGEIGARGSLGVSGCIDIRQGQRCWCIYFSIGIDYAVIKSLQIMGTVKLFFLG